MTLYARTTDNNRELTVILLKDNVPYDLTDADTITCRLVNDSTGALTASTTSVARATQSGDTLGQCTVTLTTAEFVAGTQRVEWRVVDGADDEMFPDNPNDRLRLVVSTAAT